MARETKIGLLAGLAFIVCFAVILSNRGRPLPAVPYQPSEFDYRAKEQEGSRPRSSDEASPGPIANRPMPQRLKSPPSTGADVALPDAADEALVSLDSRGASAGPLDTGTAARLTEFEELSARLQDAEARRLALQAKLDAVTLPESTIGEPRGAERQPDSRPARSQTTSESKDRYAVAPGDTLTSIAAAHYGTRSNEVVGAIFDANRSVLSSPDVLQIGMELALPVLVGRAEAIAHESAPEAGQPGQAERFNASGDVASRSASPFRWYQIREGDRYITIARRELGDERRWPEIHELNKDKFPDPQRIRHGVRIKLPMSESPGPMESKR